MFAAVRSLKKFVLSSSLAYSKVQKCIHRSMKIQGKCALITDGTCGTGAAVARELLRKKASNVIITGSDETSGKNKEEELNSCYGRGKVKFYKTSMNDTFDYENTFKYIKENFKSLDIFFNNAEKQDEKDNIIHTHLVLKIEGIVAAYKTMTNGGVIVNLTSSLGLDAKSSMIEHSAASGGFIAAAKSFGDAEYFEKTKIKMITLCTESNLPLSGKCEHKRGQSNDECNMTDFSITKSVAYLIENENGSSNTLWLCQRNGSLSLVELQDMNRFFVKFEPQIEGTKEKTE